MASGQKLTSKNLLGIKSIKEYEDIAKSHARLGIRHYACKRALNRFYDSDDIVVEDSYLVEQHAGNKLQYTLHVIELKDELALNNSLREIHLLKHFGLNKYIMGLFGVFRHRQYVGLLQPAFLPIRSHLNVRYRFKNEGGKPGTGQARFQEEDERFTSLVSYWREDGYLQQLGLFTRDAVAFVIKKAAKGLEFIHSKGYAHTELCADNLYLDVNTNVKIGGFLHCKKLGSKSWVFTGDPNCLPPEALDEKATNQVVDKSLDYWSLGLLTLELITGKRHYLKEKKARRLAREYLDGVRPLPTLAQIDPRTFQNGVQKYDANIDSFIRGLLICDPKARMGFKGVINHPFISASIARSDVFRQWRVTVDCFDACDGTRSLFHEMFAAQGSNPDLNEELLHNVVRAIRHVEQNDYPLFSKVSEKQLCNNYIGIEASVAIPYDDTNWSRDVLDVSQRDFEEEERLEAANYKFGDSEASDSDDEWEDVKEKRKRSRPTPEFSRKTGHPTVDKDYQRFEVVFFVKKQWSAAERQIFIAMQFARWYQRGVIHFVDLIRVVDEIEEIINDYILTGTRITDRKEEIPEAVYFASPRRDIRFNPDWFKDQSSRYLQHIYVDVGIHPRTNQKKLRKFEELMEGDPVELPDGVATLQASVCFQDVDPRQFEDLEAQMIGEMKVANWDFDETQRHADATIPETKLYRLLIERRRNYNNVFDSYNDEQWSNQARCHKIWGDFTRDYLYKVCKWAIPYRVDEGRVKELYGDPFATKDQANKALRSEVLTEEEQLDKELTRTRIKQEEDRFDTFKRVEDGELRQQALEKYKQEYQGQEGYHKLENQLARGKGAAVNKRDPLATPAAHGTKKIVRRI